MLGAGFDRAGDTVMAMAWYAARPETATRRDAGEGSAVTLAAGSDVSAGSGRMALARLAFVFFCAALVGRILGGDALLNQFYAYTAEGGNLAGKIHPSNYLFMLAAGLLYAGPGFRFRQDDLPLLRAIILFGTVIAAICVLLVAPGRSGAVGYVIDTYLLTLLAMTLMLAFPFAWRAAGAMWIIAALVFNAFLAMGEFAIGRYIIPFEVEPAEFRPAGLLGAALTVGVMNLAVS